MSFYRTLLTVAAAFVLSGPVFADDTMTQDQNGMDSSQQQQTQNNDQNTSSSDQKSSSNVDQSKVNLNTASAKELMKVKGLNAAKAKAIVSYRKKHGDFTSVDQLREVKGFKKMKDKNWKNLQDQLTIG